MVTFGCAWAVLGWLPLLVPALSFQPYYALLGAMGAWLALGVALSRRVRAAALVVAMLALLRPARAATPAFDWGSEWYHRRAAEFLGVMRSSLLQLHAELPPHTRLYFLRVPSQVGLLSGGAPALRVWYGDATLRGAYLTGYRPRAVGEPRGRDYFFRYDTTREGWVEIVMGAEDVAAARATNPSWQRDHEALAATLTRALLPLHVARPPRRRAASGSVPRGRRPASCRARRRRNSI